MRTGATMDLRYQWFHRSAPIGKTITVELRDSDIYLMSDWAVGWNWKSPSLVTLRHSAGAAKYTALPKPKVKAKGEAGKKRKAANSAPKSAKKPRTDAAARSGAEDMSDE